MTVINGIFVHSRSLRDRTAIRKLITEIMTITNFVHAHIRMIGEIILELINTEFSH